MKVIFLILFSLFLLTTSCTNDNITGGAKGIINFGEGDCSLDQTFWYYYKYNGYAYAINKTINDTLNQSTDGIFKYCDSTFCSNGSYSFALEPGVYYIFIKEFPQRGNDNQVTVNYQSITETDLFFFRCL